MNKEIDFFMSEEMIKSLNITSMSVIAEGTYQPRYIIKSTDKEEFIGNPDETKNYLNKLYNFNNRLDKLKRIIGDDEE